jgi:hypothetical protein
MAQQPQWARAPHYRGLTITLRHTPHSVGPLWTSDQPTQRPLPDDTQHLQETDIHAVGGSNPQSQKANDRRPTP